MPFYQIIVLAKITDTQTLASYVGRLVHSIHNEKGVITQIRNLGDRIPARPMKGKDRKYYNIIRYLSFDVVANPKLLDMIRKIMDDSTAIMIQIHKKTDREYFKNVINEEIWSNQIKKDSISQQKLEDFYKYEAVKEVLQNFDKNNNNDESDDGEDNDDDYNEELNTLSNNRTQEKNQLI